MQSSIQVGQLVQRTNRNAGSARNISSSTSRLISNLENYDATKNDTSPSNVLCVLENLLGQCTQPLLKTLYTSRINKSAFSSETEKARTKLIHYAATVAETAADLIKNLKAAPKSNEFYQRPLLLLCYDILEKLHELHPCKIYLTTRENKQIESAEHAVIYVSCAIDILQRSAPKRSPQQCPTLLEKDAGRIQRAMGTLANAVCALERCTYGTISDIGFRNTQVAVCTSKIASEATPENARFTVAQHLVFRADTLMQLTNKIKHSPTYSGANKHYVDIAFEAQGLLMDSTKRFAISRNKRKSYSLHTITKPLPENTLLTGHNLFEGLCFANNLLSLYETNAASISMTEDSLLKEYVKVHVYEICKLFKNSLSICYGNALPKNPRATFSLIKHPPNSGTIAQITAAMNSALNSIKRLQEVLPDTEEAYLALRGITLSAERIISRFDSKNALRTQSTDNYYTNLTTYPGEVMEIKATLLRQKEILEKYKKAFRDCIKHLTEMPDKLSHIVNFFKFPLQDYRTKKERLIANARELDVPACKLPNKNALKQPFPTHVDNKPSSTLSHPKVEKQKTVLIEENPISPKRLH